MRTEQLCRKATELRMEIIHAVAKARKGHIGGALSVLDILVVLFHGGFLRFNTDVVEDPDHDRFILSKGHCAIALYAVLADLGFFPKEALGRYNANGSVLGEHPDHTIPGVESISGSLGNGLGVGAGLAWAAQLDHKDTRVFVVLGDGECHEGANWEAALFAAHHNLRNLIAIVDRNGYCVQGSTENIVRLEPFEDKWRSFGWNVHRLDGHDFDELVRHLKPVCEADERGPTALIADTIKGRGISFMENKPEWHHGVLEDPDYRRAVAELEAILQ